MTLPKIYYVSDLHVDINGDYYKTNLPDDAAISIMVIAGDINTGVQGNNAVRLIFDVLHWYSSKYKHVVVTLGNHDFYGNFIEDVAEYIDDLCVENCVTNIHILDTDGPHLALGGYNFCGDTFWSSLQHKAEDPIFHLQLQFYIADFRNIKVHDDGYCVKMHPAYMVKLHKRAYDHIFDFLTNDTLDNKIVVTHFPPSKLSIHQDYADNVNGTNEYFVNNYSHIIAEYGPLVWIHGHVHNNFDYMIAKTRVVCNPLGYSDENLSFNKYAFVSPPFNLESQL